MRYYGLRRSFRPQQKDSGLSGIYRRCPDPLGSATHSILLPTPNRFYAWQRGPFLIGEVEVEVHRTMQQTADQIVAGLLAEVGQEAALENACKKSR